MGYSEDEVNLAKEVFHNPHPSVVALDLAKQILGEKGILGDEAAHKRTQEHINEMSKALSDREAQSPHRCHPVDTHTLRTDPEVFDAVMYNDKTFEIRKDDRGFLLGDKLILRRTMYSRDEMDQGFPLEYTGESVEVFVTYILYGPIYGLAEGWVVMSVSRKPTTANSSETESNGVRIDPSVDDQSAKDQSVDVDARRNAMPEAPFVIPPAPDNGVFTISVLIGNSDNRLSQVMWTNFIAAVNHTLLEFAIQFHCKGYSAPTSMYQNACFVFEASNVHFSSIEHNLRRIARKFSQDSIAIVYGDSKLIRPSDSSSDTPEGVEHL